MAWARTKTCAAIGGKRTREPREPRSAAEHRVVLPLDVGQEETLLRAVPAAAWIGGARGRSQRHAEANDVAEVLAVEKQLPPPLIDERLAQRRRVGRRERSLAASRTKRVDDRPGILERRRRARRDVRLGDDEPRLVAARDPDWRRGGRILVLPEDRHAERTGPAHVLHGHSRVAERAVRNTDGRHVAHALLRPHPVVTAQ